MFKINNPFHVALFVTGVLSVSIFICVITTSLDDSLPSQLTQAAMIGP